jgi:hypothetical protein
MKVERVSDEEVIESMTFFEATPIRRHLEEGEEGQME